MSTFGFIRCLLQLRKMLLLIWWRGESRSASGRRNSQRPVELAVIGTAAAVEPAAALLQGIKNNCLTLQIQCSDSSKQIVGACLYPPKLTHSVEHEWRNSDIRQQGVVGCFLRSHFFFFSLVARCGRLGVPVIFFNIPPLPSSFTSHNGPRW